jgi:hypothetical protein
LPTPTLILREQPWSFLLQIFVSLVRKLVEKDILRRQLEFLLNNPWRLLGGVVKIKSKLTRLLNTWLRFSPCENFLNTLDGHFFLIFSVFLSEALYLNQREEVVDLF